MRQKSICGRLINASAILLMIGFGITGVSFAQTELASASGQSDTSRNDNVQSFSEIANLPTRNQGRVQTAGFQSRIPATAGANSNSSDAVYQTVRRQSALQSPDTRYPYPATGAPNQAAAAGARNQVVATSSTLGNATGNRGGSFGVQQASGIASGFSNTNQSLVSPTTSQFQQSVYRTPTLGLVAAKPALAQPPQFRTAQNCNCAPAANYGAAYQAPSIGYGGGVPNQPALTAPQPAYQQPNFQIPSNFGTPQFGAQGARWWTPFVTGSGAYSPLIKLQNLPPGTYLGQGIIGQPTAYVDGQPVRNLMRYVFP